jgi:hypothetical protein
VPAEVFLLINQVVIQGWVILFEKGSIGKPMSEAVNENLRQVGSSRDVVTSLPNGGS